MEQIENLVFQGGGVKTIAYTGALEILEKYGVLKNVKRVAGTSAGAIPCLLLALRYNTTAISEIIFKMNIKAMEDHFNPLRILTHYGLYKGDALLRWLKDLIKGSGLHENATFAQLQDFGGREMRVFATDLNEKTIKEFSVHTTPNVKVAEAIRASMSIPLFFEAWQFPDHQPNNHFYVDGGMVFNYPLTVFDHGNEINKATLGFHIDNLSMPHPTVDLKADQLLHYIRTVFDMLMHSQILDFLQDEAAKERTVRIDDFGVPATDFHISVELAESLHQSGRHYTEQYMIHNLGLSPENE